MIYHGLSEAKLDFCHGSFKSSKVLLTVCAIDGWSALLDRWKKATGASANSLPHVPLPDICWVVVSNIFNFHPYLGKWSNLTNIFQMGWNHMKPPTSLFLDSWHAVLMSLLLNGFPMFSFSQACSFIFLSMWKKFSAKRDESIVASKLGLKEPKEQRPPEDGAGRRRWQSKSQMM